MIQTDLFDPQPPDETQPCTRCGATIITQHFTPGHVSSEFVGEDGECWKCSRRARLTTPTLR
jgi:hypothetical protein